MSDPKKEGPAADDMDWASALDEWEQKAFSSVMPPPVTASVAPPAPSVAPPPAPPSPVAPPSVAPPPVAPPPVASARSAPPPPVAAAPSAPPPPTAFFAPPKAASVPPPQAISAPSTTPPPSITTMPPPSDTAAFAEPDPTPTPRPEEDRTLASSADGLTLPTAMPVIDVSIHGADDIKVEVGAVSTREVDIEEGDVVEEERPAPVAASHPSATPPPLPVAARARTAPPPPLPLPVSVPLPSPGAPAVRIEESPAQPDEPVLSVVTGTLQALATIEHEEQMSRGPARSLREVGANVAALLEEQATWLEAEAAAAPELVRARVFLALSEIRAILGDKSRAHGFAARARDLAPQLGLAHRQARSLAASEGAASDPRASAAEAAALMAEEACAALPAAKQHAALLAADVLRLSGDVEGALLKLSRVADTGEIRGVLGAATLELANGDLDGLTAFAARPEAQAVARGLTSALKLRGLTMGDGAAAGTADGAMDALQAARQALETGDTVGAAQRIASLRRVPELAGGAGWLASALAATKDEGRTDAVAWLTELAQTGDLRASRVLAARAVEGDDGPAASAALTRGGFSAADELALSALLEINLTAKQDNRSIAPEMGALHAAVAVMDTGDTTDANDRDAAMRRITARAARVVGSPESRAAVRMARLLAAKAPTSALISALADLRATSPSDAAGLDLELAFREDAYARVSDHLRSSHAGKSQPRASLAALAAALVAERAGDPARALAAYREARKLDRSSEVALRAIAALHSSTDLPGELNELADELGATAQGGLARLEAVIREDSVDDVTRADLLERAHRAAPGVPLASFLAERIALRTGNADEALRWMEERRAVEDDPTERVVSALRETRLVEPRDPSASAARIADAHRERPSHLALREAYERTLPAPPDDWAPYWEAQAAATTGDSRALLFLEVAHAYERVGDPASALRAAEAGGEGVPLLRLARERAELEGGEAARLVDQLLGEAKTTDDPVAQREAYERLADIDGVGRHDPATALLWHKSILEQDASHLPSLRYVEHALIREGRDDELEPIAASLAHTLPGGDAGERVAHADLAARLRARGADGDWDSTLEVAELAATDAVPSLASLRLLHAHAHVRKDDGLLIKVTEQLLDRATRPVEMAALRLRLAESAFRQNDLAAALTSLERGASEDPGDLVAFRLLAEVRNASGDPTGAAEAHESVARLSLVPSHQLDAWYDAARLWLSDPEHTAEGVHALEQAAALDLSHEDVFSRLSALYAARGAYADLAALLDRRIALATDADERVTLEVERGRALLASGDRGAARLAVAAALKVRPDHTTALATFGDLSALEEDWPAAEDAWVRLGRLLATPDEQRAVYQRLGDLYSDKAVHLERAELAFKEVLKRAPGDTRTLERLVDVYRRQQDLARAVEVQQELIAKVTTPQEKRARTIQLAGLYEDPGHDERKAEQVLEGARREFPTDVVVLRALAEFYVRYKQTPAMNILLDRAAADARRAFAAGRFAPALFEVMRAVYDLRGKDDAARIVGASLQAIEGKPAEVRGAFGPALDPRIDDLIAPDVLSAGFRAFLTRAGGMLDVAAPIDLRAMGAQPAGPEARIVHELAGSFAAGLGLATPKIYVSKTIGRTCLPAASDPPALVIGESLLTSTNERAVAFIVMRAMKLVAARASALVRTTSTDLAALVPAWIQAVVPSWAPTGVNPTALAAAAKKVALSVPPAQSEELTSLGLEVASQLGTRASTLGGLALSWANRAALLGVGDPNAALEALAWSLGNKEGAPEDEAARTAWIGRTHEAKDLLIFSISDAYAEARVRLELR